MPSRLSESCLVSAVSSVSSVSSISSVTGNNRREKFAILGIEYKKQTSSRASDHEEDNSRAFLTLDRVDETFSAASGTDR
jgi:hypothetical protein